MTYLGINVWNTILKTNFETEVIAEEGDLVFEAAGILFLIQRKENCNNVVCQRLTHRKGTFKEAITEVRKALIEEGIQFIRVEGNRRRYKFLNKMLSDLYGDEVHVIKDNSVANRNVFYIKVY